MIPNQLQYHSNPVWRVDERQDDESVALERSSSERLFASAAPSQADVMGWVKRVRGLETKGVQGLQSEDFQHEATESYDCFEAMFAMRAFLMCLCSGQPP